MNSSMFFGGNNSSKKTVTAWLLLSITLSLLVLLIFSLGDANADGTKRSAIVRGQVQESQPEAPNNGLAPQLYMPVSVNIEPEFWYFDDFSNPSSGWPIVDNTHDPSDCFKWYYSNVDTYRAEICDDRTDVKVSPLVELPTTDYMIKVDARFNSTSGWWDSYGILFDAKDDPNPNKPDLGDYFALWILWEGKSNHKWALIEDIPGEQINVTGWKSLSSSYYNYGSSGTGWNEWRIDRTANDIKFFVNDHQLGKINKKRPTTNYQILFGLLAATYETSPRDVEYDNYLVDFLTGTTAPESRQPARSRVPSPFYTSSESTFDLIAPIDSAPPYEGE